MLQANSVEEYIENSHWRPALERLRNIILQTELEERVKWGIPYYTINNKNVVAIAGFKEHFALWFTNGVFLSDPHAILINAQEGTTKGLRHWRFTSIDEIDEGRVLAYIQEAIENQKRGLEIRPESKQVSMPKELSEALTNNPALKTAFDSLSPGKRKEYAGYIGEAKQEATRLRRLAKCTAMILEGKGLNDRYR